MSDRTANNPHDRVYIVECESQYQSDDSAAIDRAREMMIAQTNENPHPLVVIDLSETQFFGSAFVGLLFSLRGQVSRLGGRVAACGANDFCRSVLETTQFTKVCPLFGSRSEAVESMAQ